MAGGVRRVPNPDVQRRLEELISLEKNKGKVGWFESAKYPDGTPVAYVAMIQEMGSPKNSIPPRSFLRTTMAEKGNAWRGLMKSGCKAIMAGNETAHSMMDKVVGKAAGDVRRKISQIRDPALSPVTVLLRQWKKGGIKISGKTVGLAARLIESGVATPPQGGSAAKPLVDTGIMLQTLTHHVGSDK